MEFSLQICLGNWEGFLRTVLRISVGASPSAWQGGCPGASHTPLCSRGACLAVPWEELETRSREDFPWNDAFRMAEENPQGEQLNQPNPGPTPEAVSAGLHVGPDPSPRVARWGAGSDAQASSGAPASSGAAASSSAAASSAAGPAQPSPDEVPPPPVGPSPYRPKEAADSAAQVAPPSPAATAIDADDESVADTGSWQGPVMGQASSVVSGDEAFLENSLGL